MMKLLGLIQIIFILAKIFDWLVWSWILVFIPAYIMLAIVAIISLIVVVCAMCKVADEEDKE